MASDSQPDSLAERRLKLEEAQHELEQKKFEKEITRSTITGFINNNLGVVVSAIVGVATIVVSGIQLRIATDSAKSQLDLERQKLSAASEKDSRAFSFGFAKFLLEKQDELNTNDELKVKYLRNVVIATLPIELVSQLTRNMADSSSSDRIRSIWADGLTSAQLAAKVTSYTSTNGAPANAEQIISLIPQIASSIQRARLDALLSAAQEGGITETRSLMIFLSLVLQNTNYLKSTVENLNYLSATRILAIFPRIIMPDEAEKFVKNPELLANRVYAGRGGNREQGDGWRFRSRGFLGTFGRTQYERSSQLIGIDLVANPDNLGDDPVAAREAVTVFKQLKPAHNDIIAMVRAINGGLNGLAETQALLEKLLPEGNKVTDNIINTESRRTDQELD